MSVMRAFIGRPLIESAALGRGRLAVPEEDGGFGRKGISAIQGFNKPVPVYCWEVCDADEFEQVWLPKFDNGEDPARMKIDHYEEEENLTPTGPDIIISEKWEASGERQLARVLNGK